MATLSATIEGEDADETRSSLQTSNNNVVYWTAKDRIRVVNTTTYESWIYELVSGAGTSVGKFEPLGAAATCEEDLSNIAAVYPAVAAIVDKSAKTLSFTVNHDWNKTEEGKERLTECNIRSWNNDSPTAFTHNDIKVSYHVNGSKENANFKFRQLGTWCVFAFDFTSDESIRKESLQSIEVTTTEGDVQISGTQRVDLTDPNLPRLAANTNLTDADKTVKWTFNSASSMSTAFTRSMMLFPGLENKQLKITAETNMHTFVFYAKPQVKLEAGTVLKFPIGFKQNFNTEIGESDNPLDYAMAYTSVEKSLYPFYYYGDANCYLIAGAGKNSATIDVTPHQASPYYEKKTAKATDAPKPAYAKVIWYETAMGAPKINGAGQAAAITGDNFTVTLADATKYGNALIGIYESAESETPLWSYHIWHPQDDPTQTLRYGYTYSGAYDVMPIALGATAKATVTPTGTATNDTNLESLGYYYQWGRKDPLGRPNSITATAEGFVAATDGDGNAFKFGDAVNEIDMVDLLGGEDVQEKDGKSVDVWMVEYATANPTRFIKVYGPYGNDWAGLTNNNLWGNPQGYDFPTMGGTYKSAFDPCPNGYRVAPKDLWVSFTIDGNNQAVNLSNEATWPENIFNILNINTTTHTTTLTTQRGYFFCYGMNENGTRKWQQEPADFYSAAGIRNCNSGSLSSVGSNALFWCSSPYSSDSGNAGFFNGSGGGVNPLNNYNRSYGFNIRCVKEQ